MPGGRRACGLFGVDRGRRDVMELLRQTQLFADLPDAALEHWPPPRYCADGQRA